MSYHRRELPEKNCRSCEQPMGRVRHDVCDECAQNPQIESASQPPDGAAARGETSTCVTCGSPVVVRGAPGGTRYYEPADSALRAALAGIADSHLRHLRGAADEARSVYRAQSLLDVYDILTAARALARGVSGEANSQPTLNSDQTDSSAPRDAAQRGEGT